jgi:hypothetical protein
LQLSPAPASLPYQEAYDRALSASQALNVEDLITINIDVPTAITTAVGALPGMLIYRDQANTLTGFDKTVFDQLETYTLATGHAHTNYMAASAPPEAIIQLNSTGMALRQTLYLDALALAQRGLISGDRIAEFKANIGYKNLAFDLMALAGLLRSNWATISGRTGLLLSELDQADTIGAQLVNAVGAREQAPAAVAEVSLQRQRNFTLFVNAYDQARRAISYLRWDQGDLEQIAPSLYAGRASKKKPDETQPGTAPTAGAPAGTPATGTAPATPAPVVAPTGSASAPAAPAAVAKAAAPAAPGLPGAFPFVEAN